MSEIEAILPQVKRIRYSALGVGIIALVPCVIGAFFDTRQFFHSYLIAYLYVLGTTLGSMGLVMLYHLTSGYWGLITRRLLESASRTLPLVALFTIPLLIGLPQIYQWTNAAAVAADRRLQAKQFYLTTPLFVIREIIYFALWFAMAYFLNRWSAEQDATDDPAVLKRLRFISAPGLVLLCLSITFAGVDWLMSLEPHYYSTTFGFRIITGQAVNAMAFSVVLAMALAAKNPIAPLITKKRLRDLGNMLFAMIMLWAYIGFTEFLIIWAGNIPDETAWFRHRFWAGWGRLAWLLLTFHFFVPFFLLLQRAVKHRPRLLMGVAAWLLFMRVVELFWMVEPSEHAWFVLHWMDVLVPVGLAGIWLSVFLWQLGERPLMPAHDPLFEEQPREQQTAG